MCGLYGRLGEGTTTDEYPDEHNLPKITRDVDCDVADGVVGYSEDIAFLSHAGH